MVVRNRIGGPTQRGVTASTTRRTKGGRKPAAGRCTLGASLSRRRSGKAPLRKPALQPYWGKPAVRNDRGIEETSASFEVRSAPRSYPTPILGLPQLTHAYRHYALARRMQVEVGPEFRSRVHTTMLV